MQRAADPAAGADGALARRATGRRCSPSALQRVLLKIAAAERRDRAAACATDCAAAAQRLALFQDFPGPVPQFQSWQSGP